MAKQEIIDDGGRRNWRTEIPNLVIDFGLTPHQFRLYVQLKRVAGDSGLCWQSTKTLADACSMSAGTVSKAKRVLVDNGLIMIERRDTNKGETDIVRIIDVWVKNYQRYSGDDPVHQVNTPVHQVNTPVHQVNTPVHQVKQRSNPNKKEPNKKSFPKEIRDPMMEKIADMCAMDLKLKGVPAQIGRVVTSLLEAGYTIDHLNRFGKEVWVNDWRWQKNEQRPKPHDILTEMGKLNAKATDDFSPGNDQKGEQYKPVGLTEVQADWNRRKREGIPDEIAPEMAEYYENLLQDLQG